MSRYQYFMEYRPAGFETLPPGLIWELIAAPWDLAHRRRDLPRSDHRHGTFSTDRELTARELTDYQICHA